MIRSTRIILIVAAIIIVGGASIFGIIVAVNWGRFDYSNSYYYQGIPLPIERLNINSDIGAINIKYNTTPTNYIVEIDLDIRIEGGFVAGKSFSDFFEDIIWVNDSSPITFELDKKPITGLIIPIIFDIKINVALRTDIIYDINALTSTGAVDMVIPQNVILNNTIIGTSTGSIFLSADKNTTVQGNLGLSTSTGSIDFYANQINLNRGISTETSTASIIMNFTRCVIGDDISGLSSTGSIIVNSYNMKYTKDCDFEIITSTSSIDANIKQYVEMNANITGTFETSTGSIDILYDDSLSIVGAEFTCTTGTGSINYYDLGSGGMSVITGLISTTISTDDYNSATSKYTFSVSTGTGSIKVWGQSF